MHPRSYRARYEHHRFRNGQFCSCGQPLRISTTLRILTPFSQYAASKVGISVFGSPSIFATCASSSFSSTAFLCSYVICLRRLLRLMRATFKCFLAKSMTVANSLGFEFLLRQVGLAAKSFMAFDYRFVDSFRFQTLLARFCLAPSLYYRTTTLGIL